MPDRLPRLGQHLIATLVVLTLLSAACGSTVRPAGPGEIAVGQPTTPATDVNTGLGVGDAGQTTTAPGSSAAGTAAPTAAHAGATTGATGTTAGAGSTATRPGATTAGAGASSGGSAGPTSGASAAGGPGGPTPPPGAAGSADAGPASGAPAQAPAPAAPSAEPIKIGFTYLEGATNVMNSMGTEVSFGDGQLEGQAVVDAINARGGINGRMLEAHFAGVNVASADPETEFVAACTELTEDKGVFVIANPINPPQSFVACAAEHETLLINASFNPGDDELYNVYGDWFFSPSLLSLNRGAALMIDTLAAEGAFDDPLLKVGILFVGDDPQNGRVVERTMTPRLDQVGVNYVVAEATDQAQVAAAQLRFAAEGVNLVLFMAPNGIAQILFMQAAENQRYRPKYFTTDPDSTRFVSETAPRAQAQNIRGIGTLPISNVPVNSYPTTPAEEACLEVIRAGGEDNQDRLTNVTATIYCEMGEVFAAVATAAGPDLSADSWRAAYHSMGTSHTPITTFGMDLSTGRNDNATLYRSYAWDAGCSCMAYTSPSMPIPR